MPGSIGSVSVSVVPDLRGFTEAIRGELEDQVAELGRDLGEILRDAIQSELDEGVDIKVNADAEQAQEVVADLKADVEDLKEQAASGIDLNANPEEANAGIDEVDENYEALRAKMRAGIVLDAQTEEAVAAIDEVGEAATESTAPVSALRQQVDQLGKSVEALEFFVDDLDESLAAGDASADELAEGLTNVRLAGEGTSEALHGVADAIAEVAAAEQAGTAANEEEAESLGKVRDEALKTAPALQAVDLSELTAADSAGGGAGGGGAGGLMAGLLVGVLALGPAFIAAAAAEAIFVGAAIPDIMDIVHNTGAFRGDLTAIKAEYMQLAAAVKPEVITDFDIALAQAKDILPEFTGAAQAGGKALGQFLQQFGDFLQSGDSKDFLAFISGAVPEDMHAFGNLLQGAATAGMGFSESLNSISMAAINAVGGVLSFGGTVLREVPWLGQWAVAIGAAYFAAAKLPPILSAIASSDFAQWLVQDAAGLTSLGTAYTIAAGGARSTAAAVAAGGTELEAMKVELDGLVPAMAAWDAALEPLAPETAAITAENAVLSAEMASLAVELAAVDPEFAGLAVELAALDVEMAATAVEGGVLAGVLAVLDAVNPLVWVAAAAVAVGALTYALVEGTQSYSQWYKAEQQAAGATQDSYQNIDKFAASTHAAASGQGSFSAAVGSSTGSMGRFAVGASIAGAETATWSAAAARASQQSINYNENLSKIEATFGITAAGAQKLAAGAGVAGTALDQSGEAGEKAARKVIDFWQQGDHAAQSTSQWAVQMSDASDAALQLSSRVTDLTTALNKETGGTSTAIQNTATFQSSLVTLKQDLDKSHDSISLFTSAGRASAAELATVAQQSAGASAGFLQIHGTADAAREPLLELRAVLEKVAGTSLAAREMLAEVNKEIAGLHSKNIHIGVTVEENAVLAANPKNQSLPGGFPGGTGAAGGAVIPGYEPGVDRVGPIWASRGESILVPELTRAIGASNIMAANHAFSGGRKSAFGHAAGGLAGVSSTLGGSGSADEFNVFLSVLDNASPYSVSQSGVADAERLAREFSDGTLKTVTQIRDAGRQAITALKDYYTGPHARELEGALGKQVTALEDLAKQSANIAAEVKGMKAAAAAETQSLQSFSDISNITGTTDSTTGVTAPVTGGQIHSGLVKMLNQLHQFLNVIKRLQAKKVDKTLIQQVIALGPADGITYGEAILAGGSALITDLNRDEKDIAGDEKKVGQATADIDYGVKVGGGIGKGFLSELKAKQADLDKEFKRYGDVVARELEDALHGKVSATSSSASVSASSLAPAGSSSVGGTIDSSSGLTRSEASDIVASLRTIDTRELGVIAELKSLLAVTKQLPKATGAATGSAVADALNSVATKAASKARARVR